MKKAIALILVAGIFNVWQAASAADVTGAITFKGTPPPETDLAPFISAIPDCAAMYQGKKMPTTQFYVVGSNGELADVVVSLKDADGKDITGKSTGASAAPAVLDQKGCIYEPQIVAIQSGQKLLVKNSDMCVHNVDFTPTVAGNQPHNDVQMMGQPDITYTFPNPEMFIMFKCDVHPWMRAWVSVFDSPYFAVSGKDGRFTIKNVPPGKYTIVANHRKAGIQTQVIEVGAQGASANFTFEAK